MKIIFVAKNSYNEDRITKDLKDLCEQDSIAFFYSYSAAEEFISNKIVSENSPVDLIICENNIGGISAESFIQNIRKDKTRTYSNADFHFYKIPVVLIVDSDENKNAFRGYGFSDVFDHIGYDRLHLFVPQFISKVKDWRKAVLDELDNLGIKFNSGKIDYTYYFSEERKREIDTKILSENFRRFPRRLRYDWLKDNETKIEKAIDGFIKELKRASRLNKKREEKRIHKLFNKYPFLLKRDNYNKHWYQPKLHYNKTEYYEPDYSLRPNFNHRTDLSILEVKLPNERFLKKSKFHPKPYAHVFDHIMQVNDYKDYLESDEFHSYIKKTFGFLPNTIEYNLLMGRLDDKTEGLSIFNKRMKQMNVQINFITYDELLDYQVKYLERMRVLKIW